MRPVRIEVEGFSAYRSRVVVDFTRLDEGGAAFFSLTGATGAGKSSLVDAMIFALYGRIPRLDGRAVAPVVTAGADRARVRFDFEAHGEVYTAVRLVQRTRSGGATVKEARLQVGERVIAGGAAAMTSAVEDLLGLGFEDFTRTVVLPQGEFARFLHAKPSERQDLLRGLLGIGVLGRVGQLARDRRSAAQARVDLARARLDSEPAPTPQEIESLRGRLAMLDALDADAAEWEEELVGLEKELSRAEAEAEKLADAGGRLTELRAPEGLDELAARVTEATDDLEVAEENLEAATSAVRAAEQGVQALPGQADVDATRKARRELNDLERRIAEADVDAARRELNAALEAQAAAETAVDDARTRLEDLRATHAAHTLAAGLVAGRECPVCGQVVESVMEVEALPGLEGLEELSDAVAAAEAARSRADSARDLVTGLDATRAELKSSRERLTSELADAPGDEELDTLEQALADATAALSEARAAEEPARNEREEARRRHEDRIAEQRGLARKFLGAQQSVGDLKPPISESDDVVVQWKELLAWRDDALARLGEEIAAAREHSDECRDAVGSLRARVAASLTAAGIEPIGSFRAAIAAERAGARHLLARSEELLAELTRLADQEELSRREAAVAKALADHLRTDGFEKWLMAGALQSLVAGANGLLAELSDDGYSLHVEDGEFSVIDHRNADERRSVRTLSGGETFLVSLALALSLAEIHAAQGDARLEAVILDEGFGTLDDETLDTVAAVLEDLATRRGLVVGVITHVKELADRASVRFEVARGPKGSTVREVA